MSPVVLLDSPALSTAEHSGPVAEADGRAAERRALPSAMKGSREARAHKAHIIKIIFNRDVERYTFPVKGHMVTLLPSPRRPVGLAGEGRGPAAPSQRFLLRMAVGCLGAARAGKARQLQAVYP